jgi:shikimate kinase
VLDATWRRRPVVLVGLMGSGKTTVGRALARLLERPFVDSDAQLAVTTGATAKELAATVGPDELHRLEGEALLAALAGPPAVVAAAAAVVLDPTVVARLLSEAVVVWLRADVGTLAARVVTSSHRPFVDADAHAQLAAMERERAARYEAVADLVADTAARDPEALADQLAAAITAAS